MAENYRSRFRRLGRSATTDPASGSSRDRRDPAADCTRLAAGNHSLSIARAPACGMPGGLRLPLGLIARITARACVLYWSVGLIIAIKNYNNWPLY